MSIDEELLKASYCHFFYCLIYYCAITTTDAALRLTTEKGLTLHNIRNGNDIAKMLYDINTFRSRIVNLIKNYCTICGYIWLCWLSYLINFDAISLMVLCTAISLRLWWVEISWVVYSNWFYDGFFKELKDLVRHEPVHTRIKLVFSVVFFFAEFFMLLTATYHCSLLFNHVCHYAVKLVFHLIVLIISLCLCVSYSLCYIPKVHIGRTGRVPEQEWFDLIHQ